MGRLRCAWGLGVHLATLACLATLFGCGGEEEHAFELDRIRPPRGGEQCDQTWRGPSEDEAVAAKRVKGGSEAAKMRLFRG